VSGETRWHAALLLPTSRLVTLLRQPTSRIARYTSANTYRWCVRRVFRFRDSPVEKEMSCENQLRIRRELDLASRLRVRRSFLTTRQSRVSVGFASERRQQDVPGSQVVEHPAILRRMNLWTPRDRGSPPRHQPSEELIGGRAADPALDPANTVFFRSFAFSVPGIRLFLR